MDGSRPNVAAVETHVSWLFFGPERVYKIKRPVVYDFLDFRDLDARGDACEDEVELNRRLSPDVYLGVGAILGPDRSVEPAVVMRRLPAERRLSGLVERHDRDVEACLEQVAARMASFHEAAERSAVIADHCRADAVSALWHQNLEALAPFGGSVLDADEIQRIGHLAMSFLAGRRWLISGRVEAGHAVDGHGDLLADDIFCLPDGPRIIDCLEFDARLRHLDPLADVAFLALDLERLGRPDLARSFLDAYRRNSGDDWPVSLEHHWVAHRAVVRAKVACLRHALGEPPAAAEARRLLATALSHLEAGAVRLVLVGGAPGTGKSTLAARLGEATGWPVLRSDVLRKELAGRPVLAHYPESFGAGLYQAEATAAMYAELLARARRLLEMGRSVILDASWVLRAWREGAAEVAAATASALVPLECEVPLEVAVARVTERARSERDPSDATAAVARVMYLEAESWPEAEVVDTTGPKEAALERALWAVRSVP